ncbi:hypothetical protein N0V82_002224 [Gnomoniopsis sp. IMI 355080]|nr:hypothetical protein N0V82_002224 [Gnomoniopsis sp. IMI 355080]
MADPLSITASVAGLISLGVQVIGGITQYLDAVRERKDDLVLARKQVDLMRELLKLVESVSVKIEPTHNSAAASLKASASVESELKALEQFVRRIDTKKPSTSHAALGKVSLQAKMLTYPFHRPTLVGLLSQLTRVNEMLQAALQVVALYIVVDIENTTLPNLTLRIDEIKPLVQATMLQISQELGQDNITTRNTIAAVEDSVRTSVTSLSGNLDQGLAKTREDILSTSIASISTLRADQERAYAKVIQELAITRSDLINSFGMMLGTLPSQDLGRLLAKPGQLKEKYRKRLRANTWNVLQL